ncbi:MAG: hypothetical protein ACOCRK_02200 [bacterium]
MNINNIITKSFLKEVKKVWYYAKLFDFNFPNSCALVSMYLTYILSKNKALKEDRFTIEYCRGHYRIEDNYDDDYDMCDFPRDCKDCTCYYMNQHSWIELLDKESTKKFILDFTAYQFLEEYPDIMLGIKKNISKKELYDYLMKFKQYFCVLEEDEYYRNYYKAKGQYAEDIRKDIDKSMDNARLNNVKQILDLLLFCTV